MAANGPRLGHDRYSDSFVGKIVHGLAAYLEHDTMTAVSETHMGALLKIVINTVLRLRAIPMQKAVLDR